MVPLRRLAVLFALLGLGVASCSPTRAGNPAPQAQSGRPNVLWILGDDLGPDLACYGETAVRTPNLDRLAASGVRFTRAFTTAPVCSPSRSAWNTGRYQIAFGAQNHRSHRGDGFRLPDGLKLVSQRFHDAGYFTANVTTPAPGLKASGKTDFNFNVEQPFDGTGWSQRAAGQPFYAQINFTEPHRGNTWPQARKQAELVDPAKVKLPPFYPDHPLVRDDYANYLDAVHQLDTKVGAVLKRLDDEGLAENTIVFFFGDNGRCHVWDKQWLYEGGLHVPLLVRWPRGSWKAGTVQEGMVSAIDIPVTSLALAGVPVPPGLDGQVILGAGAKTRSEIFGARDRCDETVDRIRSVRTDRYKLIRNYYPDRPYTQANAYKERQYPVLNLLKQLHAEGKLNAVQDRFLAPTRPAEELYDLKTDPGETHNLAALKEHQAVLKELRARLDRWLAETKDQGAAPEDPAVIEKMK